MEQAIGVPGLRVVLTPGLPAPWSESAKSLLHVKRLSYAKVRQVLLGPNEALLRWTAQSSAPVAVWNDEPARATWIGQLYLFERLQPEPRLIPADFDQRVLMLGLCHEIGGEDGYSWNRRHIMARDRITPEQDAQTRETFAAMGRKYGYTDEGGTRAPHRCAEILGRLASRLEQQRVVGSPCFIGHALTALDIYWACHATTLQPLPDSLAPMPPAFRDLQTNTDLIVKRATAPILLTHRDINLPGAPGIAARLLGGDSWLAPGPSAPEQARPRRPLARASGLVLLAVFAVAHRDRRAVATVLGLVGNRATVGIDIQRGRIAGLGGCRRRSRSGCGSIVLLRAGAERQQKYCRSRDN